MSTIDSKYTTKKLLSDIRKLDNEMAQLKVKCECSHTMVMINVDRMICSWCGYWVYKDDKAKFKYKMRKELKND